MTPTRSRDMNDDEDYIPSDEDVEEDGLEDEDMEEEDFDDETAFLTANRGQEQDAGDGMALAYQTCCLSLRNVALSPMDLAKADVICWHFALQKRRMMLLLSTSLARGSIPCPCWTSWAGMNRTSIRTSSRTGVSSQPGRGTAPPKSRCILGGFLLTHCCHTWKI